MDWNLTYLGFDIYYLHHTVSVLAVTNWYWCATVGSRQPEAKLYGDYLAVFLLNAGSDPAFFGLHPTRLVFLLHTSYCFCFGHYFAVLRLSQADCRHSFSYLRNLRLSNSIPLLWTEEQHDQTWCNLTPCRSQVVGLRVIPSHASVQSLGNV